MPVNRRRRHVDERRIVRTRRANQKTTRFRKGGEKCAEDGGNGEIWVAMRRSTMAESEKNQSEIWFWCITGRLFNDGEASTHLA